VTFHLPVTSTPRTVRAEPMWGTVISVDVREHVKPAELDEIFAWFVRIDQLFSTWRSDSEISRLGIGELHLRDASAEVRTVLSLCDELTANSRGAFDIRVGSDPRVTPREGLGPIDPSGMVKGWALQHAAEMLRGTGISNFLINAGGDLIAAGNASPGQPWQVGIQHPWQHDKVAAVVSISDLGVATSGRYERGDHIIDPRTGEAATSAMSVTVIGPDLAIADGYATAALVLGEDGPEWLDEHPQLASMTITNNRRTIVSTSFDSYRC
jgi:thiamine biosynthesis lipoprotein